MALYKYSNYFKYYAQTNSQTGEATFVKSSKIMEFACLKTYHCTKDVQFIRIYIFNNQAIRKTKQHCGWYREWQTKQNPEGNDLLLLLTSQTEDFRNR